MKNGVTRSFTALFVSIITLLCNWLNLPVKPMGQKLDLTGYEQVFCDEFDGDALDTEAWFYRQEGLREGTHCTAGQVKVADGALTITAQYREDGEEGAGWYSGMLALCQKYTRGYFEVRCKCAPGGGFWSAFWLQASGSYVHDISRGGVGAAEIDVMEAPYGNAATETKRNAVTSAIHCNGGDDDPDKIDSKRLGKFRGNDIYNTYNTYGLEWTEDEYIFYINGVETTRSSFSKGVSQVPEEVIVSLEIPNNVGFGKDYSTSMVVDYVKIWQKP